MLDGAAPPGTPIPLGEVAELFGVSPIPVRESLKTLIGEGLVDHKPNSGYAVAQLTSAELREIYIVRESLETAALSAALPLATADDDAAAREANHELEQAIRFDDPVAYHRHSREFHLALTAPSRMFRLLHMLESAWNMTEPVQPMVHSTGHDRSLLHRDHVKMLDAFLARDLPRLLSAAEVHHQRLNSVIAKLPTDTGLLAQEDISSRK